MRDFEVDKKNRSRVLSGLKILGFVSCFKPDNILMLVF